jgi:hypothetical protein
MSSWFTNNQLFKELGNKYKNYTKPNESFLSIYLESNPIRNYYVTCQTVIDPEKKTGDYHGRDGSESYTYHEKTITCTIKIEKLFKDIREILDEKQQFIIKNNINLYGLFKATNEFLAEQTSILLNTIRKYSENYSNRLAELREIFENSKSSILFKKQEATALSVKRNRIEQINAYYAKKAQINLDELENAKKNLKANVDQVLSKLTDQINSEINRLYESAETSPVPKYVIIPKDHSNTFIGGRNTRNKNRRKQRRTKKRKLKSSFYEKDSSLEKNEL